MGQQNNDESFQLPGDSRHPVWIAMRNIPGFFLDVLSLSIGVCVSASLSVLTSGSAVLVSSE